MKRACAASRNLSAPADAQSVAARRKALQEEMQQAILKLKESCSFRLDDFIVSSEPGRAEQAGSEEPPATPSQGSCQPGPLYVSRPLAPTPSESATKPILTFKPEKAEKLES